MKYSSFNNNTISLEEEENYSNQTKTNTNKKKLIKNKEESSPSFFGFLMNSVSKIGQGLKNIMSKKINIEYDDDINTNLYDQISNRFNNNEEINLIDAPSFMEESNIQNKSDIKNKSNKKNESDIMMISQTHNEINNNNINIDNNNEINNNIENDNNFLNNKKQEIITTSLIQNNDRKIDIKSNLLNKKRNSSRLLENILEEENEEEKNDEENINNNISITKNKLKNKNKVEQSINSTRLNFNLTNNTIKNKKLNNTSMMSVSMKSLDNIKNEISKRREENLRNIEDMHKRHGLYYDYEKEGQIRDKILDEYYKEKAKKIAEVKLQMEIQKRKREEDFQKLKVRKVGGFKYGSIQKKPPIFTESKNTEIHFKPIINKINNETVLPKKEEIKIPNIIPKANPKQNLNITFGGDNQSKNGETKEENKNIGEKIINNINENKPEIKNGIESTINTKKENENQPVKGLFDLNNNKSESKGFSLFNNEKKNESENEKKPIFDNKNKSIFGNMIVKDTTAPIMGNMEEEKKKESKQEDFFGNSNANLANSKQEMNSLFKGDNNNSIFKTEPSNAKGGLFDQNNQVSQAINQQSLFNSNNPDNQNTLLGKSNPFINPNSISKNQSTTSLFGNENQNKDKNNTPNSLFGNISGGNNSLFGAPITGNKLFS